MSRKRWDKEHLEELLEQWTTTSKALTALFYGEDKQEAPEVYEGLNHDGNRAWSAVYANKDHENHRVRVRWGIELSWFVRFAEYILEKEGPQDPEVITIA